MTINSENRKDGPFICNGVTVDFPFTFKVFSAADVLVVLLDASNVETDLTLTMDYSVSLNADQDIAPGGTVTTLASYATGNYITLSSNVPYNQLTKLTNSGGFYPTTINDALDRLCIQNQQIFEKISRAALLPISGIGTIDPDTLFFGINAAGNAAELKAITDLSTATPASLYMLALLSSVDADAARSSLGAAKSGANSDISSLNNPSLGSATAVTQADGDTSTKVATTAYTINAINIQKALDVHLAGNQTISGIKTFQNGAEPIGLNICKAWVTFDGTAGTPTPIKAFNVSSITKNGTGDFTINFTTALPDANYAVVGGNSGSAVYAGATVHAATAASAPTTKTTTAVRVRTSTSAAEDKKETYFVIFG